MNDSSEFVSQEALADLTGRVRPSAQARWLAARHYVFERGADGKIKLRKAELDRHTLSKAIQPVRRRRLDLSSLESAR